MLVATLTVGCVAVGFAVNFNRPDLIRVPSGRAVIANAGLPDQLSNVAILAIVMIFAGTGVLIFWRRSADPAAMLFALLLVTGCLTPLRTEWAPERAVPWLEPPVRLASIVFGVLVAIVFFVFPDGRFVPRWTMLLGAAAIPLVVLLEDDFPLLVVQQGELAEPGPQSRIAAWTLAQLVFVPAGLYAQVYRYRHVSGPVQRQQTKWVALAMGLALVAALLGFVGPASFVDPSHPFFLWSVFILEPVFLLLPFSIAVAILRHRLFDIDRLISRTVTYAVLTIVLGTVGFASNSILERCRPSCWPSST
jgi:hypothetical protein